MQFGEWRARNIDSRTFNDATRGTTLSVYSRPNRAAPELHGTRAMNINVGNVLLLPLEYNEYAKTANKLLLDNNDMTQQKLTKILQNVCLIYACLGVKRNAGIVGSDAKYASAAQRSERPLCQELFRWARNEGITFPAWLTREKMECTTNGGEREKTMQRKMERRTRVG